MRMFLAMMTAGCFGALTAAHPATAASVETLPTKAPVSRVIKAGQSVLVESDGQAFALVACETPPGLCLKPARASEPKPAPADALPDGEVASASNGDIRSAWYGRPTGRYGHGVLGDAIEGGSLVVSTADGKEHEFVLPEAQVFEDITPRIADLDGDGTNEVITIRASQSGGAAIVIYGLVDGALTERGAGTENGQRNRWLNVAGLVPARDGGLTLYAVRTPHIGGRLFSIDFRRGKVTERNELVLDVSNHLIGSRELDLSAVGTFGGNTELVLPSQNRKRLRFPLSGRADIALPGTIDKAIAIVEGRIVTATEDGVLVVVGP